MNKILRNKIPGILRERNLTISDLHNIMARESDTRTSYPAVHRVATEPIIPDTLSVGTLRKVAVALGVSLSDLSEIVDGEQFS